MCLEFQAFWAGAEASIELLSRSYSADHYKSSPRGKN